MGCSCPFFFVNIGLSANVRSLGGESLLFMLAMTAIAIVSKIVGAGLGGRLGGLTNREALQLGVGMMSRGEVGLIVVTVGIDNGIIGSDIFAAIVGVVILTTFLTPPLLRSLFANTTPESSARPATEATVGETS